MERADSQSLKQNSDQSEASEAENSESGNAEDKNGTWQRFNELAKGILGLTKQEAREVREKTQNKKTN